MAGISVSGLISNSFDWKSVVDQLIQIDSAPIARMQAEESTNLDKLSVLGSLDSKITSLQDSVQALSSDSLFKGRTAASATAGSTWTATAADLAATGSYKIAVSQLATAARWVGSSRISKPINATNDVSALPVASMATATAVSPGTFTVNGQQVTIAAGDMLGDVFTKISAATGGLVTASYSAADDKITLQSGDGSPVVLGASNDTSNFLAVTRLATTRSGGVASGIVTSSGTLGTAGQYTKLVNSRLQGGFGSVDGAGNGQFSVNGVPIAFNINNDSLADVLNRITASTAGVTANYDTANDRVVLTNTTTGDTSIGVSDNTGTLAAALGLTSGSLDAGKNALYTVNDGPQLSSLSNTLDPSSHGIVGLSVTVNTASTETVAVSVDTASMKSAIKDFVAKFNDVQDYISSQTAISTSVDGKVTTSTMSGNREMQDWASEMRDIVSGSVSGLGGAISRLSSIGIDFTAFQTGMDVKTWSASADQLVVTDTALDSALANNSADVAGLFNASSTGLITKFKSYLSTRFNELNGALQSQKTQLNSQNTSLEDQIATINRRLAAEREQLTSSFLAMQDAQSTAQTQQATLTNFIKGQQSSS